MLVNICIVVFILIVYFLGVGITKIVLDNMKDVADGDKGFICSLWPIFLFMWPLVTAFAFFFNEFPKIITGKKDGES